MALLLMLVCNIAPAKPLFEPFVKDVHLLIGGMHEKISAV